jgi:4-hydroxybutyrate CoA-transferase
MAWQDVCSRKLVDLDVAIGTIASGDVVHVAPYSTTPMTLCNALIARAARESLENIRIDHPAAGVSWSCPGNPRAFRLKDNYATPPNRAACHAGSTDYLPIGVWKSWEIPPGFDPHPDVFLVPVSPPNALGFCSFGSGVWLSRTVAARAKRVIAEVNPSFIRTGGENYIHVDEIDLFVEARQQPGGPPPPPPGAEDVAAVEVICTMVAAELVNDGDTLQMGVGTVSASLAPFLDFRNDLGIQTELITGGVIDLVERGIITGARKTLHPRRVVGSAFVALPPEELARAHENPPFELYDFGYTDDLRTLIQQDNFVAVNNALVVDLTGQVTAEALDHRPYTGVGGQTVFMIAGAYSKGGKSVSVLPSSAVPTGSSQRFSRIVPTLGAGAPVTVPRTYVDYVVTEHGIAELRGKTLAERARALADIAHPEFRDALRDDARRLYHA